jgi:signal transduction histidine kinase
VLALDPFAAFYGLVVVCLSGLLWHCVRAYRQRNAALFAAQVSNEQVHELLDSLTAQTRLAGDVHDVLAQGFTAIVVQLQAATDARSKGLDADADEHLEIARRLARENLQQARNSAGALRGSTVTTGDPSPEA